MAAERVPTTLWDLCGSVRDRDCLTFPRRKPRREAEEAHLGWQESEASLKCVMCLNLLGPGTFEWTAVNKRVGWAPRRKGRV